jgi:choice-of-anchor C domain-containing protein
MLYKKKMIVAGFAALAFAGVAQADGLQDGSFEQGASAGSYTTEDTHGSIGAWNVTSGNVDLIGTYWQAPPTGGYSVDMNGSDAGTISQSFTLPAGQYTLSFYLAGNPDDGNTTKSVQVSAGDASQMFVFHNADASETSMGWALETLTFTTDGSTTVTFSSPTSGTPYGAAIGGVSVSAVPEPGSVGLLLAGLGMIGVMSSRRRVR